MLLLPFFYNKKIYKDIKNGDESICKRRKRKESAWLREKENKMERDKNKMIFYYFVSEQYSLLLVNTSSATCPKAYPQKCEDLLIYIYIYQKIFFGRVALLR
jgi:hypothetical protein